MIPAKWMLHKNNFSFYHLVSFCPKNLELDVFVLVLIIIAQQIAGSVNL